MVEIPYTQDGVRTGFLAYATKPTWDFLISSMQIPCGLLAIGFASHHSQFAGIQARVYIELENFPAAVPFTIYSLGSFVNVILFMSTRPDREFAKPRCASIFCYIKLHYYKRITQDVK